MFAIDLSTTITGKATVQIDLPARDVFSFVGDHFFENYPKWALEVIEFEPLDGLKPKIGAKAKQKRHEQGQTVVTIFRITEFEPCKILGLEAINGEFRHRYTLEALTDSGPTVLNFSFQLLNVDMVLIPFEKLIRTAIEEGVRNSVENIKNLLFQEYTDNKTVA